MIDASLMLMLGFVMMASPLFMSIAALPAITVAYVLREAFLAEPEVPKELDDLVHQIH